MSSQDEQQEYRVAAVVLIAVVLMAVGLAVGVAIQKVRGCGREGGSGHGGCSDGGRRLRRGGERCCGRRTGRRCTRGCTAPAAGSDDASVVVENGVVKFYFASGKSDLAPGALWKRWPMPLPPARRVRSW